MMNHTSKKKLVLFGAGRIGRSFIAQLFHNSGYELTFIDVDAKLINLLNTKKSYTIVVKGGDNHSQQISGFKALSLDNIPEIEREITETDLCAVSVGQRGFGKVSEILSQSIETRFHKRPEKGLDIILAENLRNAANIMHQALNRKLPPGFPLDKYVGLIEASIGKMVPLMTAEDLEEDPLQIFAEPYNTLILDKQGFINPVPDVDGLSPKQNMKAWVDRKLFIHNLGHVSVAYLGYLKNPEWKFTWEALEDMELKNAVFRAMQEAATTLIHMYPEEFTQAELTEHINDLLNRFANKSLNDTIFRVGCEIGRKLGSEDRLVPVIKYAHNHNLPFQNIMKVLVSGIYFEARDENNEMHVSDQKFLHKFNRNLSRILVDHCKFTPSGENDLIFLGMNLNERIIENIKK